MANNLHEDLLRPTSTTSSSITQEEVPLFSGLGDSFASLLNSVGLSTPTAALVNQISEFIGGIPEPTNAQPSEYYQSLPSGTATSTVTASVLSSSSGIPRASAQHFNHNSAGTTEASFRAELETSKMELASLRFEFQELKAQMARFEADMARLLSLQRLEPEQSKRDDGSEKIGRASCRERV